MHSVVIGSSGFIAKHLIRFLEDAGHIVDKFHHNDKWFIRNPDYIFYLASYGNHYNQKDKYKTIKANIWDFYRLLKETIDVPYKRLIHFSSSSVSLPVQTTYSESKYIAELIGHIFRKKHHKDIVSVRPYSVYGPGEADFRFIPTLIRKIRGKEVVNISEGWHDWIYVDDFIHGVYTTAIHVGKIHEPVEIGTGTQVSNSMVANMLARIIGNKLRMFQSDEFKRVYDTDHWQANTKLIKTLGWKPGYLLEEGLTATYNDYE